MDDYTTLSRAELIQRLRALEPHARSGSFPSPREPTQEDAYERLRAILETSVEGIITIDEQGVIETYNRGAEAIFGWKAPEIVGRSVNLLMPSPDRERHDGYIANYLRTGQAKIIGLGREVVGLRKDGRKFPMELAVSEVRLARGRLFTGFVRDITERKESQARLAELAHSLAEKNKELENIVYVASHDLRSPLVNIQGFGRELSIACQTLRDSLDASTLTDPNLRSALNEDIPEALNFIQAGVVRIDSLLSGLLRYSRLGRAALRPEVLRMNDVLSGILRAMEFQIQRADAEVVIADLPDCIGDLSQITQVFSNVLDNALKYLSPNNPGVVEVSGKVQTGTAIYSIRDNGIGIDARHLPRIFEIFHRLNPDFAEGEGLGLTIAQRILERHGGRIWVESRPGEGSSFHIALKASPPDA